MDRNGPGDAKKDERDIPALVRFFAEEALVEHVAADVEIQKQVAIEHDHVPGEHGDRPVKLSNERHHVPEAVRPAEICDHEHQAHDNRSDGQQLADDDGVVHVLVMINIGGNDHHHTPGGETDEEGEVRDVESP